MKIQDVIKQQAMLHNSFAPALEYLTRMNTPLIKMLQVPEYPLVTHMHPSLIKMLQAPEYAPLVTRMTLPLIKTLQVSDYNPLVNTAGLIHQGIDLQWPLNPIHSIQELLLSTNTWSTILPSYLEFASSLTEEERQAFMQMASLDELQTPLPIDEDIELDDKTVSEMVSLFPDLKGRPIKNIIELIITTLTLFFTFYYGAVSHEDAERAHLDALQAHQDAIQAHQDAIQSHQDSLESKNDCQTVQQNKTTNVPEVK
ncbi:hypothetical protein [uncultured Megasphaera sp.]|uniref:hypothetical protein n=1 Tax=uncultured Megasphaera sp. TaxID=165188 RepID=UPI00266D8BDE|nr:hypothetical protein [uncultured Megasphaera sp.]